MAHAHADNPDAAASPKPRRSGAPSPRPELPLPPASTKTLLRHRPWFWMFVLIGVLVAIPLVSLAWNVLRPDDAPPAPRAHPASLAPVLAQDGPENSPAASLAELIQARLLASALAARLADAPVPPDIAAGRAYDATLTPRFLKAFRDACEEVADATPDAALARPPFLYADIAALDGALRARCAGARAAHDATDLNRASVLRLRLAAALRDGADTPGAFRAALDHERSVFAEIRADAALLVTDLPALKDTLAALAAQSLPPSVESAEWSARAFDAALDREPDAELLAMRAKRDASATGFLRLALLSRRPNAHRAKVSELLADFAAAAAKPAFPLAYRTFRRPGDPMDARLAAMFLRDTALKLAPADPAVPFFFRETAPPEGGLETFGVKLTALASSDDIYGQAMLLRRHASLTALLARRDRTRFDAAGTAYALALEFRRDPATGKLPRDIDGLFADLCDTFPSDPFTDDAILYSRKKMTLHSPGADGVDLGGIEDAEFASENAQLWEPTIPLEPERPTNPAAFGVRPSDLDKPVRKPWEFPLN